MNVQMFPLQVGERIRSRIRRALIVLCVWLFCLLPSPTTQSGLPRDLPQLPALMAWAWEREEDLRWLPANAGVAYVAATVELRDASVTIRPRAQALRVRDNTALVPVVHVDSSFRWPPTLSPLQREAITNQVVLAASRGNRGVVQLDFEARRSQRGFYRALIDDIRERLPAGVALSMTALASWCMGDDWLVGLPVDEIVPMAFRMGSDDQRVRAALMRHGEFTESRCRPTLGLATDEVSVDLHAARRYYFSPVSWNRSSWQSHVGQ